MSKAFYLERVEQKSEVPYFRPYAVRYAWSYAEDPDIKKRNDELQWQETHVPREEQDKDRNYGPSQGRSSKRMSKPQKRGSSY